MGKKLQMDKFDLFYLAEYTFTDKQLITHTQNKKATKHLNGRLGLILHNLMMNITKNVLLKYLGLFPPFGKGDNVIENLQLWAKFLDNSFVQAAARRQCIDYFTVI